MDVIYDIVESIHIFIPIVAIVFICIVLYANSRREEFEAKIEGSQENGTKSKIEEDKKNE